MTDSGVLGQLTRRPRRLARAVLHHTVGPRPQPVDPMYRLRAMLAEQFLQGNGLEIGALAHALNVPSTARVRYVDRKDLAGLRAEFPELAGQPLTRVDIVDDAERLHTIENNTQDFLIGNHLLEHMPNPIGVLKRFLEVLRPGGVLYLAIPDKRGTFDRDRPLSTLEHLYRDFADGPAWSQLDHYYEYVQMVDKMTGAECDQRVRWLAGRDYRIHFHVWTSDTFWEFLTDVRRRLNLPFEVQAFVFNAALSEAISVLKKQ